MIKENPDDSVLDEQHGANSKAAGTGDTNEAENAKKTESKQEEEIAEENKKSPGDAKKEKLNQHLLKLLKNILLGQRS